MALRTYAYCALCAAWLVQVSSPFCPHAVAAKVHGHPIEDKDSNAPDMPTNVPFGIVASSSDTLSATASFSTATAGPFTQSVPWHQPAIYNWVNGDYIEVTAPEEQKKTQT